ncbi:hypothetical protein IL306_002794 [Fusarium sp. DS 682]|nr:hypothetical protein IL306_002794 [Fusarium sp. DS 682]
MKETLSYAKGLRTAPLALLLNRRTNQLQPIKPLLTIVDNTFNSYIGFISVLFHCIQNMMELVNQEALVPFAFSNDQQTKLSTLFDITPETTSKAAKIVILDAFHSLFAQKIYGDPFDSPLLSALAFLSVQNKAGGQWYEPTGYPAYFSALAKFAPLCAFQRAQLEAQANMKTTNGEMMIQMVEQEMIDTVYVKEGQGSLAKIRHNQYNPTTIVWVRNDLTYKGIKVTVDDLRQIVASSMQDLKSMLKTCLLVTQDVRLDAAIPELPPLSSITDDPSQTIQGHCFLRNSENLSWVNAGNNFLILKVQQSTKLQCRFINGAMISKSGAKSYITSVQRFLNLASVLITMTGGQPPRGPEILSINVKNTPSGIRNIFIRQGRVSILTLYHKMMNKTGETRPIWRFLPDSLGRLIVIYLWIRHIAIAITKRYHTKAFKELEELDIDDNDEDYAAIDQQASHSSFIANTVYAQEAATTVNLEEFFLPVTLEWHRLLNLQRHKDDEMFNEESFDLMSEEELQADRQADRLASLVHQISDEAARLVLRDPRVSISKDQMRAFDAICAAEQDVIFIAPTGSGKSFIYSLPAFLQPGGITIVVSPLTALQQDQLAHLRAAKISAEIWQDGEMQEVTPSVMFVSPEYLGNRNWLQASEVWRKRHMIDRVVIDEAHLVLTPDQNFRSSMAAIGKRTLHLSPRRLFLSATIPKTLEASFKHAMAIEHCKFIRVSTNRPNLRYRWWYAAIWKDQKDAAKQLVKPLELMSGMRAIIYCHSIGQCIELAHDYAWLLYHAEQDDEVKEDSLGR